MSLSIFLFYLYFSVPYYRLLLHQAPCSTCISFSYFSPEFIVNACLSVAFTRCVLFNQLWKFRYPCQHNICSIEKTRLTKRVCESSVVFFPLGFLDIGHGGHVYGSWGCRPGLRRLTLKLLLLLLPEWVPTGHCFEWGDASEVLLDEISVKRRLRPHQ